jgi:predicted permease
MRFSWKRAETELEREIAHHIHHLTAEYERQGYPRREALLMARREFGGAEQFKEQCRDERRFAWFAGLRQDLTFGIRMMRGAPAITIAAVLSLALGIGANATIASLMDVVLWRSLPVPSPKEIRLVHWQAQGFPRDLSDGGSGSMYQDGGADVADFFSYPAVEAMRKAVGGKASVAAYSDSIGVSASFNGSAVVSHERPVSGNFFSTLQVRPAMGRLLTIQDDHAAAPATVVLSHRMWSGTLGSDPNIIGKTLVVNNRPHEIVGVLEPSFFGLYPGDNAAIYAPIHHAASRGTWSIAKWIHEDRLWGTQVITRVASGTDVDQLRATMDGVFHSTWSKPPTDPAKAPHVRLDDGSRGLASLSRSFRNPLFVLGGLVSLLLVIACANIANLLLARALARRKEIALRVSLGCSRARLMRQFLTESALIALLGGAASILVAYGTGRLLGRFVSDTEQLAITLDYRMLILVGAISAISLAIFAVFPAWQGSYALDAAALKQGGGSLGGAQRRKWTSGRFLVIAQMAMSVILVMAAVTFTRNLRMLQTADPGFDRSNLVIFDVRPGALGYESDKLQQFYFSLEQRLAATPGVASAGISWMRPMNIGGWWSQVKLTGGGEDNPQVSMNGVTPAFLELYTPRMIAGRNLTWADINSDAKVAVVSEDLARKLGGGSNVLGRILALTDGGPGQKPPEYEIVGIAPAFAATSMKERPFTVWVPLKKDTVDATVVVRTAQPPQIALPAIRQTMAEIDRNLPMVDTITMEEQIDKILRRERMFATLCGAFGILAVVLSVVGLYGVIAYSTSRRRSEIGVRLALGALPRNVLSMIMREGLVLVLAGIILGMPVVWLGAKYAEKELYQMKVFEPASIIAAIGILFVAALLAVGAPAVRASGLHPSDTLREQ